MEQWEYNLRDDIFTAFLMNNKKAANFLMDELIGKKGGLFYRYRPFNMTELRSIEADQIYLCRAIRFAHHGDTSVFFKSYVSCFTARRNSLSMWHDYADSAKGICVEYSYRTIEEFAEKNGLLFSPVRYGVDAPDLATREGSVMSMMYKPKYQSDEYEWRLWKVDRRSSDIGKLLSGFRAHRIIVGRNADRDSELMSELRRIGQEKEIEIIA